jgi:hypothetical protein
MGTGMWNARNSQWLASDRFAVLIAAAGTARAR